MRRLRGEIFAATSVICLSLTGCGITVPAIQEAWDADKPPDAKPETPSKVPAAAQIEWEIKKRVYCDLKKAVQYVNGLQPSKDPHDWLIPGNWSALVSLSLQVDETSGLSPGIALNRVLPNATSVFGAGTAGTVTTSQSFTLGLGGTLSSTATRVDKFDPYWSVAFLMIKDTPQSICKPGHDPLMDKGWTAARSSPFALESDLGIGDWLLGSVQVSNAIASEGKPPGGGGGGGGGPGKDAISYEVKFIIVSSGNVTPTWKLVRFSADTAGTFFNTGRSRTHDLIITIGPATGAQGQQTGNSNLALQVGNAVANANRSAAQSQ